MCHRIDPTGCYVLLNNGRAYASKTFLLEEERLKPEYQSSAFDYGFTPSRIGLKSKPNRSKQFVTFAIDSRVIDSKQFICSYGPREGIKVMQRIIAGYCISLFPNERSLWKIPTSSLVDIPVAFDLMDYAILFYDGKNISVETFYLVKPDLLFGDIPPRIWSRYFSTSCERYREIYNIAYMEATNG